MTSSLLVWTGFVSGTSEKWILPHTTHVRFRSAAPPFPHAATRTAKRKYGRFFSFSIFSVMSLIPPNISYSLCLTHSLSLSHPLALSVSPTRSISLSLSLYPSLARNLYVRACARVYGYFSIITMRCRVLLRDNVASATGIYNIYSYTSTGGVAGPSGVEKREREREKKKHAKTIKTPNATFHT